MKKVLSIMLAAMMVVSLFAINASAALPTTYEVLEGYVPDTNMFVQDFSDVANKTDYTLRNYEGAISVSEDGVLHMTGGYRTGGSMDTTSTTPITTGEFVYEFDFMRNDEMTADYQIFVTFQRAANAESTDANLKKYGVVIPVRTTGLTTIDGVPLVTNDSAEAVDIENGKWYTFRITVSEAKYAETGDFTKMFTVQRAIKDSHKWVTITHHGSNIFPANRCRHYGSGAVAWKTTAEVALGVRIDTYGETLEVSKDITPDDGEDNPVMLKSEDGRNADFQFDNIKVATPGAIGEWVVSDLPINEGITKTSLDEVTKTVAEAKKDGVVQEGVPATTYGSITLNWAYEPTSFVTTFDAKTNVAGGPLSVSTAGLAADSAMTTIRETEIGKWYSYKIVYSSNGTATRVVAVYRKAEDENAWTQLTYTGNKNDAEGYDVWLGYNSSSSDNNLRYYLYAGQTGENANSNCALGTSWSIRNIQVTDSYAMTGVATVADGNLTIDLNTVVADAAAMIAAVYDGDRLVSAKAVDVAAFANEAEIVVPYSAEIENPAVKIFVLNGMGTMVPMDVPVVITDAIQ